MRILLCVGITRGSTRKTVDLHVELVSDVDTDYKTDCHKRGQQGRGHLNQ
jgi:hypothetical protein